MTYIKLFCGTIFLFFLFFSTGTQLVSCTKTKTVYDTLVIKDTVNLPCNCYNLKDSLVAYYNFKGGTLKDSSGKNNHIVFNNATPTTDRFGHANGAYLFNGTNSYMKATNSPSLNPPKAITLMSIIKINGFNPGLCHGNQIFGKNSETFIKGYYALAFSDFGECSAPIDPSKEIFVGSYGDGETGSNGTSAGSLTTKATIGPWYHVVYTYEDGVSKLYLDGKLINTVTKVITFTPNAYDLTIGSTSSTQFPYWFNGVIDEVRIYNKALCADAVKQLYDEKE